MKDTKRKHLNSVKNLKEENIKYRIDNEIMRRQLTSIRNQISEILGDQVIKMPDGADDKEQIKHFLQTYYKGLENLKVNDIKEAIDRKCGGCFETFAKESLKEVKGKYYCSECYKYAMDEFKEQSTQTQPTQEAKENEQPKPSKCHNCQALGIYKRGFCFKCENEGATEKQEEKQEKKADIRNVKATPEQQNFKCSKCGTDGDDEGSFKTRNGKMFCIDCLGGEVGWKASKDK